MLSLNNIKWKPFRVEELFSIYKCKCSKAGDLKKGNTPYIGATNRNNGLMSFVEKNEKLMTQGNCITFICDGQGSVGYSIDFLHNLQSGSKVALEGYGKI